MAHIDSVRMSDEAFEGYDEMVVECVLRARLIDMRSSCTISLWQCLMLTAAAIHGFASTWARVMR